LANQQPADPWIGGFFFLAQIHLTKAQKEILRLVSSFKGLHGPLAIEAAMEAMSQQPESQWRPVVSHLDRLRENGLVRHDESTGTPRFFITKVGERAALR
jgi:hypothetical protein